MGVGFGTKKSTSLYGLITTSRSKFGFFFEGKGNKRHPFSYEVYNFPREAISDSFKGKKIGDKKVFRSLMLATSYHFYEKYMLLTGLSLGTQVRYEKYYDETHTLGNKGIYYTPHSKKKLGLLLGISLNIKRVNVLISYESAFDEISFGLGFNYSQEVPPPLATL